MIGLTVEWPLGDGFVPRAQLRGSCGFLRTCFALHVTQPAHKRTSGPGSTATVTFRCTHLSLKLVVGFEFAAIRLGLIRVAGSITVCPAQEEGWPERENNGLAGYVSLDAYTFCFCR